MSALGLFSFFPSPPSFNYLSIRSRRSQQADGCSWSSELELLPTDGALLSKRDLKKLFRVTRQKKKVQRL